MVNRILEAIVAGLLVAAVGVAFVAVIYRYVLGSALSWSFEISMALLTYITFFGSYLALRKGAHLKVDILVRRLPLRARGILFLANQGLIALIGWIMAYHGFRQVERFMGQTTTVLEISTAWYYAAVPIAGALMLLDATVSAINGTRRLLRGEEAAPVNDDPMDL